MIAIVDYGMGNLRNVRRAIETLGYTGCVTNDRSIIEGAEKVILPGVGAFGEAVKRIEHLGLREPLMSHVGSGKPLLGICLGMQLLFERSEESPGAVGLCLLNGEVKKFNSGVKVPHIGWNDVVPVSASTIFGDIGQTQQDCFYFVHSYYVPDSPEEVAVTTYGTKFMSAVQRGNVMGVQFHPEKSQSAGLKLLKNFCES
jgi:imidazole glycerol phosphate synthase glutamine amidotransferase subunit